MASKPGATELALDEERDRGIGEPIRLDEVEREDDSRGREDEEVEICGARDQPQRDARMAGSEGGGEDDGCSGWSPVRVGCGATDADAMELEGAED